ncbi:MAG: polysaccharide deacetylase family protein [Halanaerobiales bacterium]
MPLNTVWTRKFFTGLLFILLFFVFGLGFLTGDRYGQSIPVINRRLVPIYRVEREDKKIAITLDGTWGAKYTEDILSILEENDVQLTFFFAGYWLEKYSELTETIADAGHEVENHTYTHPHCNSLSQSKIEKELESTSDLIQQFTGRKPRFFRPPFGEYNDRLISTARSLDYQVVQWSLDSLDWKEPGENFIVNRILENVSPGEIILMHNNAPDTPGALERLLPELKERGYEIVPLSRLIYSKNYDIQSHNGLQIKVKRGGRKND